MMTPTNSKGVVAEVSGGGNDAVARSIRQSEHAHAHVGHTFPAGKITPDTNENTNAPGLGSRGAFGIAEIARGK